MASSSNRVGFALVGNPGAGKSTILNGIAGKPVFKSGVSLGAGMTTALDRYDLGSFTLFDTPGLSDTELLKKAGEELDKLLKQDMNLRICFVVTLESGRARPMDARTINSVLSAIKGVNLNDRFGIVINQLSEKVKGLLELNDGRATKVRKSLSGDYDTSFWHYVLEQPELSGADNGMLMTPQLAMFLSGLPLTKPHGAEVEKIDTATLEEKEAEFEQRMRALEARHESEMTALMHQYEQQKQEAAERMKRIEDKYETLDADYRNVVSSHEQTVEHGKKVQAILTGMRSDLSSVCGQLTDSHEREMHLQKEVHTLKREKANRICAIQ